MAEYVSFATTWLARHVDLALVAPAQERHGLAAQRLGLGVGVDELREVPITERKRRDRGDELRVAGVDEQELVFLDLVERHLVARLGREERGPALGDAAGDGPPDQRASRERRHEDLPRRKRAELAGLREEQLEERGARSRMAEDEDRLANADRAEPRVTHVVEGQRQAPEPHGHRAAGGVDEGASIEPEHTPGRGGGAEMDFPPEEGHARPIVHRLRQRRQGA
jgi:hypothetical protein